MTISVTISKKQFNQLKKEIHKKYLIKKEGYQDIYNKYTENEAVYRDEHLKDYVYFKDQSRDISIYFHDKCFDRKAYIELNKKNKETYCLEVGNTKNKFSLEYLLNLFATSKDEE